MQPTREMTAYHEAGHIVAHLHFGLPINSATILPTQDYQGAVAHPSPMMINISGGKERKAVVRQMIIAYYAGYQAERIYEPRASADYSREDDYLAFELSRQYGVFPRGCSFVGDEVHDAYLDRLKGEADRLVRGNWGRVTLIAEALLERGHITGLEALELVQ